MGELSIDQCDVANLKTHCVTSTDDNSKYDHACDVIASNVVAVMTCEGLASRVVTGAKAALILDRTNLYSERGGQVRASTALSAMQRNSSSSFSNAAQ